MPRDPLSETWLIRASAAQKTRWEDAAYRAGYRTLSEWIRHRLDDASLGPAAVEVVEGPDGLDVYVPDRQHDATPYAIPLRKLETAAGIGDVLLDLGTKTWCTAPILFAVVRHIDRMQRARR